MTALLEQAQATTRDAGSPGEEWLRAELEETARRLRDSERFRASFLARVSHELRTPLHAIIGFADLLASNAAPSPAAPAEYGREIHAAGLSLLSLIDDLLDSARAEGDDLKLELAEVTAPEIIEEVLTRLRPLAAAKEIALAGEVSARLPAVLADPGRLRQVLWQLGNNAVKFTPRSGRVILRALRHGSAVRFDIEDTGVGIQPDSLRDMFASFVQGEDALRRNHGGAGLGLALAHRLVTLHGGRIVAASAPGLGSRFWFTIPAVAAGPAPAEPAAPTQRPSGDL